MPLSASQLTTLKTELQTDPRSYGYAASLPPNPANWNAVRDKLTLARDGTNGGPVIIIRRNDVTPLEILQQIDTRDLKVSPTVLEGSWLESLTQLTSGGALRLFNDDDTRTLVANNILRLVPSNTQGSQTRLDAMSKRNGSRAEELLGQGVVVTDTDVEAAWRLP